MKRTDTVFAPSSLSRIICLFIVVSGMLTALSCSGDPFMRPYSVSLDGIGLDGDLNYAVSINKLQLSVTRTIDVELVHQMTPCDYGEVHSELKLRPFETDAFYIDRDHLKWSSPNGSVTIFSIENSTQLSEGKSRDLIVKYFGSQNVAGFRECQSNGVVALISNSGETTVIEDENWVLVYQSGKLSSFRTPEGDLFKVTTKGRMITSVFSGEERIVEVRWNAFHQPFFLKVHHQELVLEPTIEGRIGKISNQQGELLVMFLYDDRHLLSTVKTADGRTTEFTWKKIPNFGRGDAIYSHPFSLASADDLEFSFSLDGEVVTLTSIDKNQRVRRLVAGYNGANVRWIKEY